jgi:intracellular septation protein
MSKLPIRWTSFFAELVPLLLFFLGFNLSGMYLAAGLSVASGAFISGLIWKNERRMPLFVGISMLFSLVFLVIAMLVNETVFIKVHGSIVNGFFGIILLGGLVFDKPMMKLFFASQFQLDEYTWVQLSRKWGYFFIIMMLANELAWRMLDDAGWVFIKLAVFPTLTVLFMASLWPMTKRGMIMIDDVENSSV